MAVEMVIWENLKRTLETLDSREAALPQPLNKELHRLRCLVARVQRAVASLEGCDHIHGNVRNLVTWDSTNSDYYLNGYLMYGRHEKLSTLLHQAGDILDQILTFDHRTRRENRSQLVRLAVDAIFRSNQIGFPKVMAGRVEKISNEIETLIGQLGNELDSTNEPAQRPFQHIEFTPAREIVTGRDEDKTNIVNMLLQPPVARKSNVSVICMSGQPGVGKSALAKDIYEDQKVKSHFDLRMWLPVSQIIDHTEIIHEIVESCTNRSKYHNSLNTYQNNKNKNTFRDLLGCQSSSITKGLPNSSDHQTEIVISERRLRKQIRGKLFLLILDDCSLKKWQHLRDLLAGGARGSQILVTTRSNEITDLVNDETAGVTAYQLQGLSEEHSWILFRGLVEKDESVDGVVRKTGFEIGEICKHVPFTIKLAARFLHRKSGHGWLAFMEGLRHSREQEKDIMECVLHLTYSDLPTRLRACFGYCALFPDDFTFSKHDLISLWIAQGYVDPRHGPSLEKAGEMYFMELFRRCLFEEVTSDALKNILTCKMHHVVCSLASKITPGVDNIHVPDTGLIPIPDPTAKHVSVNCRGESSLKFSSPLLDSSSLRTLIFVKELNSDIKVTTMVCNRLISSYRTLRVLDLHDLGLKEVPDSIGEQFHLRYLDLSKNDGLVTIPKSITRLYNLQTLKLNSCPKLQTLASDFGLLVNLKRLEVDECDRLTCMPLGFEKLIQLETLTRFVVGKGCSKENTSGGLKTISTLTMLRGRLAIEFAEDWMTKISEAKQALHNKSNLVEVKISWGKRSSNILVPPKEEIIAHGEILENLKPNKNLQVLCIQGYKGNDFPSWVNKVMMSSLPNLVDINIEGCGKCRFLPPFGELLHLRKLTLRHMVSVEYVEEATSLEPESQVGVAGEVMENPPFFITLEELTLHNFYSLKGWQQRVASVQQAKPRSFPRLSKLRIWNCPKLTTFPSFTNVEDLNVRNVNHLLLEECAKHEHEPSPESKPYMIKSLQIKNCPGLESFEAVRNRLGGLPCLKHLVIESCDALRSLTDDVGQISSLERLEISICKELDLCEVSKIPRMVGWENLKFLHNLSLGEFPKMKTPDLCKDSKIPNRVGWENLKFLQDLRLREIPKMERLPDGLKHVQTLKTLWISSCQSFNSLPEWISDLTALQHLRIENCRALEMLPEGLSNIRSLMKVEITECPDLMQRCREHKGEDWPKIKHARVLLHKSRRYGYV